MLKRLISFVLIACLLSASLVCTADVAAEPKFLLDGVVNDTIDVIKINGVDMISAGSLKSIGAQVFEYADGDKTVFTANEMFVSVEKDSSEVYVNGQRTIAEAAAIISDGVLYVPFDTVVKALGFQIKYTEDGCNIYKASEIEKAINSSETVDGMYVSDELLINADLEDDFTLDGSWVSRNTATISRLKDGAVSGEYYAFIGERIWGWSSICQNVSDKISEYGKGKYKISACIKTKDTPCNMNVKLVVTDSGGKKHDYQNEAVQISNTQWTLVEYIADVTWDYDVSKAEFYVESPSSKGEKWEYQDFYIDNCSLRKLMTEGEYEEILTNRIEQLEADEAQAKAEKEKYDALSAKYADDEFEVYYPSENREILINPYKGLIIYPGTQIFTGDMRSGAGKIGSILYHRFSWCYVEPEDGVYNWEMFDKNIEFCKKYGMQFGVGIGSTVNYNSNTSYNQDTPEWLFELGCNYTAEDMGNGCVIKVPDYDDPIFRERMQKMIDAFSERYNYNETIAYVDMRNYGNWGEWHFFQLPINRELDAKRTNEQFFEYIDMFKDMKLPTLSFVSKTDVAKHALETFGAGIRADGLVSPNESTQHQKMTMVKNKAMAVGEWFEQYTTVYQPGGKYAYYKDMVPILFERQVVEGSISAMAFLNWDADNAYRLWPEMYERMANILGYWYKPVKIEHSKDITKGLFKLKVKNDGVAQLFAGYEKKAVVKLALADDDGNIIDTVVLDGFDPMYWYAGEYTDCAAEYEFKNTSGGTKLLLGVFTREQNEVPNVKLGINADMLNGWYDIGSMSKSDASNLADNKLFTANQLYADVGYGFRRPEHSCDSDSSTYWANDCIKDNYLEIDFGEMKDISGIKLVGAENINLKYSLQRYKNGKWITVARGTSISSEGTDIRFRTVQTEKLRFVIDEDKQAVVKISELSVV